jgi:hypothetical protein
MNYRLLLKHAQALCLVPTRNSQLFHAFLKQVTSISPGLVRSMAQFLLALLVAVLCVCNSIRGGCALENGNLGVVEDEMAMLKTMSMSAFTWNTLSIGDTFADDYGCKSEIARRDDLVANLSLSIAEAESRLLAERFTRVAAFLEQQIKKSHSIIALQEIDYNNSASLLSYFTPETGPWKVACQVDNGSEIVMLIVDTNEVEILAPLPNQLVNFDEDGVLSCSAHIMARMSVNNKESKSIIFQSVHLAASFIRNPEHVNSTLAAMLSTVPRDVSVIFGGDFNAHLYDLVATVRGLDDSSSFSVASAVNETGSKHPSRWYFTTQHENNYIGAYDGFLIRNLPSLSSYKQPGGVVRLAKVSEHEQGLLPKYLSSATASPYGASSFHYSEGSYPVVAGNLLFDSVVSHNDNNLTVTTTLSSQNYANNSLSDHVAISIDYVIV